MAQEQSDISSGRTYRLGTAAHASAPVNGTTEPDFVLSPQAPGMLPTTGFLIGLTAPAAGSAIASGSGFQITVWRHDPVLKKYFAWETVEIPYDQDWGTADVDACEFYVQIGGVGTPGDIDVTITEQ